ncbi:hypothetical protein [Chromobacterium sphagni]|nr:hypothetical protein [Chromobacterium sphagni]
MTRDEPAETLTHLAFYAGWPAAAALSPLDAALQTLEQN